MPRPWRRPGKGDGHPIASRRRGRSRWLRGRRSARASSRSNRSGRARFSRWSKRVRRSWRSGSAKPLSVRSRAAVARRSISRRASRSCVPLPADAVQSDVEQARVRRGQVEQDHGHRCEAGTAGGDEPLVARDHAPVGAPREHRVDDPERGDRAGQGRQLRLPDAARVARIGVQGLDRQLFHDEGGGGGGHGSLRLRVAALGGDRDPPVPRRSPRPGWGWRTLRSPDRSTIRKPSASNCVTSAAMLTPTAVAMRSSPGRSAWVPRRHRFGRCSRPMVSPRVSAVSMPPSLVLARASIRPLELMFAS